MRFYSRGEVLALFREAGEIACLALVDLGRDYVAIYDAGRGGREGRMSELRILHVITRLIVGGAQENTLLTAIGQHRTPGFRVTLLAGIDDGPEGNLHDEARAAGVDLQLMRELVRPIAPLTDAIALAKLTAFCRRGRYDIVHTHSSKAGILGRLAARAAGVPIVVHTLHSLVFGEHATSTQNALYVVLKRLVAPLTHRFISVCDATRRGALAKGIGRPEQHCTVYSGFPIEPFLRIRDELSVAEAKRRVGLAARAPRRRQGGPHLAAEGARLLRRSRAHHRRPPNPGPASCSSATATRGR